MKKTSIFLCLFIYGISLIFGQLTNFREGYKNNNPAYQLEEITNRNMKLSHDTFLKKSIREGNKLHEMYSYIYLAKDYLISLDFDSAHAYLLKAENLGIKEKKDGWIGWANLNMGVLHMDMTEYQKGIEKTKIALEYCIKAQDSLCIGESYEQLSVMYSKLDSMDKAQACFDLAEPLLIKYGDELRMSELYCNYGITLNLNKKHKEAIHYYNKAGEIFKKRELLYYYYIVKNNIADAYIGTKQYDSSEALWLDCLEFNSKNKHDDNLLTNYQGLSKLYTSTGQHEKAYGYLEKYYEKRDSIIGAESKFKISQLNAKNDVQKEKLRAAKAEQKAFIWRIVLLGLLILTIIGLVLVYLKNIRTEKKRNENKKELIQLLKLLSNKNTLIAQLQQEITLKKKDVDVNEMLLENSKILTESDWQQFKQRFKKVHPGFLTRLRRQFKDITESEERLALLIKCNLNSKEIANILGINPESVKKSRQRLRKKLRIDSKVSLEKTVQEF